MTFDSPRDSNSTPALHGADFLDAPSEMWPVAYFCANGHDFVATFTDQEEAELFPVAECHVCTAYASQRPFDSIPNVYLPEQPTPLEHAKARRTRADQDAILAEALQFAQFAIAHEDTP